MSEPVRVLFLCTGNSCRSQMAEGWARVLGAGVLRARSAGIVAHGLNPRAVAAMAEQGVDISNQTSAVLADADIAWADVVVTVCGHADERCPLLPPSVVKRHWPIDDPAAAAGSEDAVASVFRACRDEIRAHVAALVGEIQRGVIGARGGQS